MFSIQWDISKFNFGDCMKNQILCFYALFQSFSRGTSRGCLEVCVLPLQIHIYPSFSFKNWSKLLRRNKCYPKQAIKTQFCFDSSVSIRSQNEPVLQFYTFLLHPEKLLHSNFFIS